MEDSSDNWLVLFYKFFKIFIKFYIVNWIFWAILSGLDEDVLKMITLVDVGASIIESALWLFATSDRAVEAFFGIGGGAHWSIPEQLQGVMDRANYQKRQHHYEDALLLVNEALEKDSTFADALYLKATILWEGFKDKREAIYCLRKLLSNSPKNNNEHIHRWALNFYRDLNKKTEQDENG